MTIFDPQRLSNYRRFLEGLRAQAVVIEPSAIEPTGLKTIAAGERDRTVTSPSLGRDLRPGDVLVTLGPRPAPSSSSSARREERSPRGEHRPIARA